jgi:hypothetical protein
MPGVLKTNRQQGLDMVIVEGVIDDPAIAPGTDKSKVAQDTEVLGDSRLRNTHHAGQITNAQLLVGKRVKNLGPVGIREGSKCFSQACIRLITKETPTRLLDPLGVYLVWITSFRIVCIHICYMRIC